MAILKSLPGVEVTITVDGEALPEYEDPQATDIPAENDRYIHTPLDSVDCMTRYIQTQPDRNFKIKIVTKKGCTRGAGLKYKITIDASSADDIVIGTQACERRGYMCESKGWRMLHNAQRKLAPYTFTQSQLKEDEQWREPDEILGNLGLIEVQVYHLSQVMSVEGGIAGRGRNDLKTRDVISHKASAIGIDHTVSTSADTIEDRRQSVRTCCATPEPIATFNFRYRSLDILRERGIVPQPPLEDRDPAAMTPEDIVELQRRFNAEREENETIKAERES